MDRKWLIGIGLAIVALVGVYFSMHSYSTFRFAGRFISLGVSNRDDLQLVSGFRIPYEYNVYGRPNIRGIFAGTISVRGEFHPFISGVEWSSVFGNFEGIYGYDYVSDHELELIEHSDGGFYASRYFLGDTGLTSDGSSLIITDSDFQDRFGVSLDPYRIVRRILPIGGPHNDYAVVFQYEQSPYRIICLTCDSMDSAVGDVYAVDQLRDGDHHVAAGIAAYRNPVDPGIEQVSALIFLDGRVYKVPVYNDMAGSGSVQWYGDLGVAVATKVVKGHRDGEYFVYFFAMTGAPAVRALRLYRAEYFISVDDNTPVLVSSAVRDISVQSVGNPIDALIGMAVTSPESVGPVDHIVVFAQIGSSRFVGLYFSISQEIYNLERFFDYAYSLDRAIVFVENAYPDSIDVVHYVKYGDEYHLISELLPVGNVSSVPHVEIMGGSVYGDVAVVDYNICNLGDVRMQGPDLARVYLKDVNGDLVRYYMKYITFGPLAPGECVHVSVCFHPDDHHFVMGGSEDQPPSTFAPGDTYEARITHLREQPSDLFASGYKDYDQLQISFAGDVAPADVCGAPSDQNTTGGSTGGAGTTGGAVHVSGGVYPEEQNVTVPPVQPASATGSAGFPAAMTVAVIVGLLAAVFVLSRLHRA